MDDATRIVRRARDDELAKRLSDAGKVQALVEERDRVAGENVRLAEDAERLAAALQMARGFLGYGIKGNPLSAAWVADEALRQHSERSLNVS